MIFDFEDDYEQEAAGGSGPGEISKPR